MKNLKITKSCRIAGKEIAANTVIENVDNSIGCALIVGGFAIEHREPIPTNRDFAPAKIHPKKAAEKSKLEVE